jgi:hypothetical protein
MPEIVTHPQSQVLAPGGIATFSVVARGAGLTYHWLSNGVPLIGVNGDSLALSGLTLTGTNLGNFSVIVSNASGTVTSDAAALWADANRNRLPDAWETAHFGSLNHKAAGDFDNDGVPNGDEFEEGTNPANSASFNPRLRVVARYGSVVITPFQSSYAPGEIVELNAIPDPAHEFTSYSGSISGTKAQVTLVMDTNKFITASFGLPLPTALDTTNLLWTTGGNLPWFGQVEAFQVGVGAAQSGPILGFWNGSAFVGADSWLQTIVNVPQTTTLRFRWNVSSRPPDALAFTVNGSPIAAISGEAVGWQLVETNLAPGFHTLRWTYTKGPADTPTGVPFADAGWVDAVSLTTVDSGGPAPVLAIALTSTNAALLSWPAPAPEYVLQQSAELGNAAWDDVTNNVTTINSRHQVTIGLSASARYFRLVRP